MGNYKNLAEILRKKPHFLIFFPKKAKITKMLDLALIREGLKNHSETIQEFCLVYNQYLEKIRSQYFVWFRSYNVSNLKTHFSYYRVIFTHIGSHRLYT